jgi:hypothetical protein
MRSPFFVNRLIYTRGQNSGIRRASWRAVNLVALRADANLPFALTTIGLNL